MFEKNPNSRADVAVENPEDTHSEAHKNRRRRWVRPPLWTFEQYKPRRLDLGAFPRNEVLLDKFPLITIVTPSFDQARFVRATIDSVLHQNYPRLHYHVQDGNSTDGTVGILENYGSRLRWKSMPDAGQSDAINLGFTGIESDVMAYLNSDDVLLPGALSYAARFFQERPDIDILYGHRIFINQDGLEIGRAILPEHDDKALLYAGYIPQETMFWRRRVWDTIGGIDTRLHYALDWDFMLRAQASGFKFARARRFLACFRVHDKQKTRNRYDVGIREMNALRLQYLGHVPGRLELYQALWPYLARQSLFHLAYKLGLVDR
jgi:glycosyltransferase involved in cell wall biosynthesis